MAQKENKPTASFMTTMVCCGVAAVLGAVIGLLGTSEKSKASLASDYSEPRICATQGSPGYQVECEETTRKTDPAVFRASTSLIGVGF